MLHPLRKQDRQLIIKQRLLNQKDDPNFVPFSVFLPPSPQGGLKKMRISSPPSGGFRGSYGLGGKKIKI
jgi:hypothetical protein